MNSFQSLLDSYTKLRKRTYTLNSLLEVVDAKRGIAGIDKGTLNKIRGAFNSIGNYTAEADSLAAAFNSAAPLNGAPVPETGLFVGLSEDESAFNFRATATTAGHTSSLPVELLDQIILFLQNAESLESDPDKNSHTSIDDDAAAGMLVGPNGELLDPEEMQQAQETAARNNQISIKHEKIIQSGMLPNPELSDVHALQGPTQIYPPGHPYKTYRAILAKLGEMFFGLAVPSTERIHEATKELQEDTMALQDFFIENQEALDSGQCIQEDETLKKLRNRFFIGNATGSNFALVYGNFEGQDENPSKMSGLIGETSEEDLESFPNKEKRGSGIETVKKLTAGDSNSTALSTTTGSADSGIKGSNPLHQLVSKYRGAKICNPDGTASKENLFKIDHVESAGNLVSTISENSAVLANGLLQAKHLRSLGMEAEAGEIEKRIGVVVKEIVAACEKFESGLEGLSKHVKGFEGLNKGTMNNKSMALQAVLDDVDTRVGSEFEGKSDKCKNVTLEILKRELNDNPIHNALQEGINDVNHTFQGKVSITMTHPGGGTVNKMTGILPAGQGVYNLPYPSRVVADSLLQCDSREDMRYMLTKLGIDPESPNGQIAMTPQHGKFILPISDKYYREDGSTSQGNASVEHLKDEEYVNIGVTETLVGIPPGPAKRVLHAAGIDSAKRHVKNTEEAYKRIVDPSLVDGESTGAEILTGHQVERAVLVADLDDAIQTGTLNSQSSKEAASIKIQLKELDSLKGTPAYKSKAYALADRVAEYKEQKMIDDLEDMDKPDKKKIGMLKAGRELRRSVTLCGTGPGVVAVKHSDSPGTKMVNHGDIRNNAAAKALALSRGDQDSINTLELNRGAKSSTRSRIRDNGGTSRSQSHFINASTLSNNKERVSGYLNS